MRRAMLAAGLALVVFAPAAPAQDAPAALAERLDAAVRQAGNGQFWGAVLVARGEQTLFAKGYGMADFADRPNTPTTLFEIASTSKQFAATAILRLAQDKKLTLDDPLARFFKGVPADKQAVTVRHLLHHTSGIDNNTGLSYASPASRDEFVKLVLAAPMISQPGEKFAYFNSGYALLAAIVEVRSGQSFEAYCRAKLFAPAKLKDTGFVNEPQLDRTRDSARRDDRPGMSGTACNWFYGWGYRGMGGAVSTVEDLSRWDRALRGDKLLKPEWREVLYTPALQQYACGWRVTTTARGTRKVEHAGGVAGYACQYARYLEDDACIVVLSNGKTDIHGIEQALAAIVLKPPRLTALIRHDGLPLGPEQSLGLGEGARFVVSRAGGDARLELFASWRKEAVAELTLSPEAARGLAGSLEAACRGKPPGGTGMDAGVFLGGYRLGKNPVRIDAGLALTVRPRYAARAADGSEIVDERPTLVLADATAGQWPVMARMSVAVAQDLLGELRKLLGS